MIILYLHIVAFNCVYGIIDTKPTCASHEGLQRCPPPSSQCPLGRVCFGRLRITPLQRGWNQIPCPRKMSLTSENLVGIKDGCTLIVLFFFWASQSIWIWWSDWWMLDLLLNLHFSWWTNNQHTCVLKVSIEIIERYELDKYGEMLRVFTTDDVFGKTLQS